MPAPQHIVIVGGGVIGLSAGIALLDRADGARDAVTLIAAELPPEGTGSAGSSSSKSALATAPAHYASAWAGAHHVSDARDERTRRWDQASLAVMAQLAERGAAQPDSGEGASGLFWTAQRELWRAQDDVKKLVGWYPDYAPIPTASLPAGIACGATFSTLSIVVPEYLPWLQARFLSLGGRLIHAKVNSLSDALSLASSTTAPARGAPPPTTPPSALLVAPGLGARTLGGVRDAGVHPVRGQTLLVEAPWLEQARRGQKYSSEGLSVVRAEGWRDTYVIPRGEGRFIVGGTRLVNDDDAAPRAETTAEILTRVLSFMPDLADPARRTPLLAPSPSDVRVLATNVGLRPARQGGARVERMYSAAAGVPNNVPVLACYGFGGVGYQASWGAVFEARDLLDDALERPRLPPGSTLASLASRSASSAAPLARL